MGCGNGDVLLHLRDEQSVRGVGVEIDGDCLQHCLANGLDVLQQDLNRNLVFFGDQSFDTVLAKEVLHYAQNPQQTLTEMLRIGNRVIIAFDNYGWWRHRLHFLRSGRYNRPDAQNNSAWYRQQSFNLFSVSDFEELCHTIGCKTLERRLYPAFSPLHKLSANLFCVRAWYLLQAS